MQASGASGGGPDPGSGLFVVGAPRCGTTALSRYLRDHPAVCFARPKETHYFVLGSRELSPAAARAEYLARHFPGLGPEHRTIAEGSPSYLYSPEAIERIDALFPEARFVVCVRNPIELVHSLQLRLFFMLDEDQEDFREAWRLQEARARGERLPPLCRDTRLLRYAEVGRLGAQLERLFKQVGRARCFVSVYDDLAADAGAVYRRLLEFAGLPDDGRTHFPRKRVTRRYRSRWLQQLVTRPAGRRATRFVPPEPGRARQAAGAARLGLRKFLLTRNTVAAERRPLDPETRRMLRAAFADDLELLASLLNRDLGHWT